MSLTYVPEHFADFASTQRGREIWVFLNSPDNLIRMETASDLSRPALEAVAALMLSTFGPEIKGDRWKQMIGHMTRQVMEHRGFQLDMQGVKLRVGGLFSKASRYRRREQ